MKESFQILLPKQEDPGPALERFFQSEWSRDYRLSERKGTVDSYSRELELRATIVDMVVDSATGARTFFVAEGPIEGTFDLHLTSKGWRVEGPSKREVFAAHQKTALTRVERSENALLSVAHSRMVDIPTVQMALSPVRSIITYLDVKGSIDNSTLAGLRKSQDQLDKYVRLLKELGYVKSEKGLLVRGPEFPAGAQLVSPKEFYDGILSRVIELGYQYLRQVVRLTQMVGYLWWPNSYYLTALEAENRVHLSDIDLAERRSRYYPSRKRSQIEELSQLQRVLDTRIIRRESNGITGDETVTEQYFNQAHALGVLS